MDLAALLEVIILHELSHTVAGGSTVDLAPPVVPGVPTNVGGWLYVTDIGAEAVSHFPGALIFRFVS